ncbi:MAG: hypothetical protein GEU90_17005 [Gemmatimonas sp.]|nr:hypothetical protein [Gemmatimonas sp.]
MTSGRKKRSKTAAKTWKYQKGEPPNTITAFERTDRGRVIEVRWWVGQLKRYQRRSLGFSIRDERGAIAPELEQEAVRQTQVMYDSLMAGRDPQAATEESEGPLTLAAGFDLATRVPEGMYVVETEQVREMRRAARDIIRAMGTGPGGHPRTWDGLSYSIVRDLWLRLARRFNETGKGGPAWTERCVVIVLQVDQWLALEGAYRSRGGSAAHLARSDAPRVGAGHLESDHKPYAAAHRGGEAAHIHVSRSSGCRPSHRLGDRAQRGGASRPGTTWMTSPA